MNIAMEGKVSGYSFYPLSEKKAIANQFHVYIVKQKQQN